MEKKLVVPNYEDIFVIPDFFSAEECSEIIARIEAIGFGEATINGFDGPVVNKSMRNNERVMLDDHAMAARLMDRLRPFVITNSENWQAVGLNERFRFYRYDEGQQFDWHFDGRFERSPLENSLYTFMVYLNDGFEGGETDFNLSATDAGATESVVPKAGMALVFYHPILHRGAPVTNGRKYVLRSDIMYQWVD